MFDSLAIAAVADEIRAFVGARVQHVVQVDPHSIAIELYRDHRRRWLLATADARRSGIWFAEVKLAAAPGPSTPLLLLMRKHLRGARLTDVAQPPFERLLRLRFARSRDAYDQPDEAPDASREDQGATARSLELIVEATGRLGNLILVDAAGTILDAVKRVPPSINRHRTILPRRNYVGPPPQEKASPLELDAALVREAFEAAEGKAAASLVAAVRGLSPQTAREAVHRAAGHPDILASVVDPELLAAAVHDLFAPLAGTGQPWSPSVGLDGDRVIGFAPYLLTHLSQYLPVESLSDAAERFFAQAAVSAPLAQLRAQVQAELDGLRNREQRRLESLERELADAGDADRLRETGELLLAYASQIAVGSETFEAPDRTIVLDPKLGPIENAQGYFERYSRARDARRLLPQMIEEVRARLAYLDETTVHLSLASEREGIEALRSELRQAQSPSIRRGDAKPASGGPLRLRVDGHLVLVGRSARQNEQVLELARPGDHWLHARGVPGAHVVVRIDGSAANDTVLARAAAVAAYYSSARGAGRVPVDVTTRRQVRKIAAGPPGAVTYSGETTLNVEPRAPETV